MTAAHFDAEVWPDGTISRVTFDATRQYRFLLERDFRPNLTEELSGAVTFCMLNPSTADALKNDPTVARCCGFAKRWAFKRLVVVNLFALRSTSPAVLKDHADPVGGPETDRYILKAAADSSRILAAWGTHGVERGRRDLAVLNLLRSAGYADRLFALRLTKAGHPEHPLYIPAATEPIPFGRSNEVSA